MGQTGAFLAILLVVSVTVQVLGGGPLEGSPEPECDQVGLVGGVCQVQVVLVLVVIVIRIFHVEVVLVVWRSFILTILPDFIDCAGI